MGVVERLSDAPGAADSESLLRLHRYRLAAEVCAGLRVVDLGCGDGSGTQVLAETAGAVTAVADEDAAAFLDRDLGDHDAIVVGASLARRPDTERRLAQLRRQADRGLRVVVALLGATAASREGGEPESGFDLDSASRAFEGTSTRLMFQFSAEGSLIRPSERCDLDGRIVLGERAEPRDCDYFVVLLNAGLAEGELPASGRMRLEVAPAPNRYIAELERINQRLRRTNQRLARERIGVADSAAAVRLGPAPAERSSYPSWVERAAAVVTAPARFVAVVILNVLPHGLTLIVLRARERLRENAEREHGP